MFRTRRLITNLFRPKERIFLPVLSLTAIIVSSGIGPKLFSVKMYLPSNELRVQFRLRLPNRYNSSPGAAAIPAICPNDRSISGSTENSVALWTGTSSAFAESDNKSACDFVIRTIDSSSSGSQNLPVHMNWAACHRYQSVVPKLVIWYTRWGK